MRKRRPPPPTTPEQAPVVTPEDASLFRDAIGPVRRLPERPEAPREPPPRPRAGQRAADEREALRTMRESPFALEDARVAGELLFRRDHVPPKVLRRLRRGHYAVQDEIDLHHMDAATAARTLPAFLADAARRGHLCVRIVHGKGLRSGSGGPVLGNLADRILRQRADVLAFTAAPPAQGGTGAVLVLLAPRRGTPDGDAAGLSGCRGWPESPED